MQRERGALGIHELRDPAAGHLHRAVHDLPALLRRAPDREVIRHFTAVIDYPDFRSPIVTHLVEPVWKAMLKILRVLVRW